MTNKLLETVTHKNHSLQANLMTLLLECLNLRIQAKLGQLKQLHIFKKKRHNIACIKYYLSLNNKK